MPKDSDKYTDGQLIVVAPETLWGSLSTGLALIYPELNLSPRPEGTASPRDPYGLVTLSQALSSRTAGILLVAPRCRSPAQLVPAPVLNGIPIGIVQADSVAQLQPWLCALRTTPVPSQVTTWVVLAMWKDLYLMWGERFAHLMQTMVGGKEIEVQTLFADAVSREDVCQRLADGPQLAVYIGHGRARGWSGYGGLRWKHVTAAEMRKPCGVLISFTCNTLKRARGVFPFGCQWVSEGRACAYVGSVDRVDHQANATFANELGQLFARGNCKTIGQLLREVYEHLEREPSLRKARLAFLTYRLMGDPLQALY